MWVSENEKSSQLSQKKNASWQSVYTQKQTGTNALSTLCVHLTKYVSKPIKSKRKKTDSGEEQRGSLDPAEIKAINDRVVKKKLHKSRKNCWGCIFRSLWKMLDLGNEESDEALKRWTDSESLYSLHIPTGQICFRFSWHLAIVPNSEWFIHNSICLFLF